MQVDPCYDNLIQDIRGFLVDAVVRAEKLGVPRSKIIVDPGIGFSKTVTHNLLLLKHVQAFASLDLPVLIGASRKAFIRKILKQPHEEDIGADLPIV